MAKSTTTLEEFYQQNPDFDLLEFAFHNPKAVNALNWPQGYRGPKREDALKELKTAARLLRLHPEAPKVLKPEVKPDGTVGGGEKAPLVKLMTPDSDGSGSLTGSGNRGTIPPQASQAISLLRQFGGLTSAHQIVGYTKEHFVREFADRFGSSDTARQIHRNAVEITTRAAHLWANVHQNAGTHARALRTQNVPEEILNYFEELPGYATLFGGQNYCQCQHCKSIFGPAAYFVDLQRIIDKYITKPSGTGVERTIPARMRLDERRPDLENIELSCANSNQTVPYLLIVNERLKAALHGSLGVSDDVLFRTLAQKTYPFVLPFQLHLQRIRTCLGKLGVKPAELYSALGATAIDITAESVGLSPEELQLITTVTSAPRFRQFRRWRPYPTPEPRR